MAEPILRWAGSKKKLVPALLAMAPRKFNRYVEPFVGSAVLWLTVPERPAVLGDLNADLIETYKVVRRCPHAIWTRLTQMPTDESFYYELRGVNPEHLGIYDRVARFIYLNRFCFNGVYRTNREGRFNVARGQGHLYIPSEAVFAAFSERLRNTELLHGDFEHTVAQADRDDFVYLDPPYAEPGKRNRGEYGPGSFTELDLIRLVATLRRASDKGAKVLLSYTDSQVLREHLHDWNFQTVSVQRNVAGFARDRKKVTELLISNYH